jgi:hypothetical protein
VNDNKRKKIEGWIVMVSNQWKKAEKVLSIRAQCPESIQTAQVCGGLTVKAELAILNIKFPPTHDWKPDKKESAEIAHQIQERQLIPKLAEQQLDHIIRLPRLLFLVNFLAQFYTTARHGFESEYLVLAKDLFGKGDAERAMLGGISESVHFGDCISRGVEVLVCP